MKVAKFLSVTNESKITLLFYSLGVNLDADQTQEEDHPRRTPKYCKRQHHRGEHLRNASLSISCLRVGFVVGGATVRFLDHKPHLGVGDDKVAHRKVDRQYSQDEVRPGLELRIAHHFARLQHVAILRGQERGAAEDRAAHPARCIPGAQASAQTTVASSLERVQNRVPALVSNENEAPDAGKRHAHDPGAEELAPPAETRELIVGVRRDPRDSGEKHVHHIAQALSGREEHRVQLTKLAIAEDRGNDGGVDFITTPSSRADRRPLLCLVGVHLRLLQRTLQVYSRLRLRVPVRLKGFVRLLWMHLLHAAKWRLSHSCVTP